MSQTIFTTGTIATDPRMVGEEQANSFCTFRLASSERRFDRASGEWVDGQTNWFTVNVFGRLGVNAKDSFQKGERILLSGRLRVRDWRNEARSGTNVEITADALGHELRWGRSTFRKGESVVEDEEKRPANVKGKAQGKKKLVEPAF